MDNANDGQVGGTHYKAKAIQPWDFITANDIGFLEGNAIKYLARWRDKGGIEDLRKARHYIDKLIELNTPQQKTPSTATNLPSSDDNLQNCQNECISVDPHCHAIHPDPAISAVCTRLTGHSGDHCECTIFAHATTVWKR